MEQVTEVVGNPTALLIERIFWLALGAFLGTTIIISLIRSIKENKHNHVRAEDLELLAKKAVKQNKDLN